MATVSISVTNVYEGIWTNWTKGKVLGLTWTLSSTHSILLTNSLALFVVLAGSQLWIIIRFAIHQLRAGNRCGEAPESDYDDRQRIVLRNAATDFNTMLLMIQISWERWRRGGGRILFPLLIATLAIIHYIIFLAAGTFSNNLVDAGAAVLSRSQHCGVINETYASLASEMDTSSLETISLWLKSFNKLNQDILLSLEYARECYQDQGSGTLPSSCSTFPTPYLKYNATILDSFCPFEPKMCHKQSRTLQFDTGFIDSHLDLGINAPADERLSFRRVTTCAVLNDTGYVFDVETPANSTSNTLAQNTTDVFYGESLIQGTNFTYSYSDSRPLYVTQFTPQGTIPYQLNTQWATISNFSCGNPMSGCDSFAPIPEIAQNSADLVLLLLSFDGHYFNPIDDPWFSAHEVIHKDTPAAVARTQYVRDRSVSSLACTEKYQFCNTKDKSCTMLAGFGQVFNDTVFTSKLTPHQNATFDRILRASESIAQITASLAHIRTPLLASDQEAIQSKVMSLYLPDDQWQLELNNWHKIMLAHFQRAIMEWGNGETVVDPSPQGGQILPPTIEQDRWFCNNIMLSSSQKQSFGVLPLILIVMIGSLVIMSSWNIEALTAWIQSRSSRGLALREIWDGDDMLELRPGTFASKLRNSTTKEQSEAGTALAETIPGCHGKTKGAGSEATSSTDVGTIIAISDQPERVHVVSPTRLWSALPPDPPCCRSWLSTSTFAETGRVKPGGSPENFRPQKYGLAGKYDSWV